MPKVTSTPDFLQRLATVEARLAELTRASGGSAPTDVPFFPAGQWGLIYTDNTTWDTIWTTRLIPRTSTLSLGLIVLGDQISATNTGGDWQILVQSTAVAASGTIAADYAFHPVTTAVDLTPYRSLDSVQIDLQLRRTSGATTGGLHSAGGSVGASLTYARLT